LTSRAIALGAADCAIPEPGSAADAGSATWSDIVTR